MIITLCGSARFNSLFRSWDEKLTLEGHTVFNLSVDPRDKEGVKDWYDERTKMLLDLAHLRKILYSDAIVVINKDGYVGESTSREIAWAKTLGKQVFFIEHKAYVHSVESLWPPLGKDKST